MELPFHQKDRARRLHEESVILLAHDHFPPPDDLAELRRGKVTGKILMAVVDVRLWSSDPEDYRRSIEERAGWFASSKAVYEAINRTVAASPDFMLIRRAADVGTAKRQGKIGILLGAEGGKLVEDSLDNLRVLYDLGLRHILLTWAYNNPLSAGELDCSGAGLTPLGRDVIGEMNRLGMIVDTTHLSRPAMREVLARSSRPVLNSHSTAKRLANRIPALEDAEIKAVADTGGVVALHFMTHMLTGRFEPRAEMDSVLHQLDALIDAGGIDCVALGPDYLPYDDRFKRNTDQHQLSFPHGLESPAGMLNLIEAMVGHGYDNGGIEKILGGNLLRFFRDTIGD